MSITQIPFQDPVAPPEKPQPEQLGLYDQEDWEAAELELDARVPHLLIQLQDDLERSRWREAVWISIIVHMVLAIVLWNLKFLEKYLPFHTAVAVPFDQHKEKSTFLALPPDLQKPAHRPKTNVLSDKDRIATARKPESGPKVMSAPPPGAPGMRTPKAPAQRPQPAIAQNQPPPVQPQQQQQQQVEPSAPRPQFQTDQNARLQTAPDPKKTFDKYSSGMTAGSAIQEAAADSRGAGSYGQGGDFGLGKGAHGRPVGALDVLSDTQGVDFGPYIERLIQNVRENWYHLIPESAEMKKGKLAIEFAITRDGKLADLRLVTPSGDTALDRPAWGAITASNPFEPLPSAFTGPYLALRFRFYYNPDKADLQ